MRRSNLHYPRAATLLAVEKGEHCHGQTGSPPCLLFTTQVGANHGDRALNQ